MWKYHQLCLLNCWENKWCSETFKYLLQHYNNNMHWHVNWRFYFASISSYLYFTIYFEGILVMGDGTSIDYNARPATIHTIMGNGRPRTASCPQCDGKARNTRLLAPTAVVTGHDGSLFVGDAELILKIGPDGNSSVVIHLRWDSKGLLQYFDNRCYS